MFIFTQPTSSNLRVTLILILTLKEIIWSELCKVEHLLKFHLSNGV